MTSMDGEIQPIWNAQLRDRADRLFATADEPTQEAIIRMIEGERYPPGLAHAERLDWTNVFLRKRVARLEAAIA
jgi:hypothetical protein